MLTAYLTSPIFYFVKVKIADLQAHNYMLTRSHHNARRCGLVYLFCGGESLPINGMPKIGTLGFNWLSSSNTSFDSSSQRSTLAWHTVIYFFESYKTLPYRKINSVLYNALFFSYISLWMSIKRKRKKERKINQAPVIIMIITE